MGHRKAFDYAGPDAVFSEFARLTKISRSYGMQLDITGLAGRHKRKGGQDHSLDNYGETMPDHGVGAVQDNSDTSTDIYHEKE